MLVRSWNLYHGMTSPRDRRSHLEESVRLVASDRPDVICLQEVPLWGCPYLEDWSGMTAISRSTRRVWFPPRLGGWITRLDQGFFRSAVSGQANAILLRPRLVPLEERWTAISRGRRERRICQAVRLEGMVIANLHASSEPGRPEIGAGEILRGWRRDRPRRRLQPALERATRAARLLGTRPWYRPHPRPRRLSDPARGLARSGKDDRFGSPLRSRPR
jgi:hypothetical protein